MKREIKFREWNGESMVYEPYVGIGCQSSINTWFSLDQNKDYDVMQFTGEVDKNIKEIYEGDIVEWEDEDKKVRGNFFWLKDACGFRIQMPKGYMPSFKLLAHHVEIIGNIYETPELLTKD